MLKIFLSGVVLFLANLSFAQTTEQAFRSSSLFVDQCGKISDNYIEPDYSPIEPSEIIFSVGASYLPGKVYLNDGGVLDGLLKYSVNGRKLLFKSRDSGSGGGKRLKADNCLGFTIQKDTFTVIENFDVIKRRGEFSMSEKIKLIDYEKPEFVEVLGEENGCSIYKFIDIKGNGQQVNISYLLHNKKDNVVKDVSENNPQWRNDISSLYGSTSKIGKPEDAEIREYFRKRSFEEKSKSEQPLFFSPYMIETENRDGTMYQAKIGRKMYWYLSFTAANGAPVMNHFYKKILPYEKVETSTYYYPNGNVRKTVVNKEGRGIAEKRYHSNGSLHYDIVLNSVEKKQSVIDWYKEVFLESNEKQRDKGAVGAISKNFSEPDNDINLVTIYLSVRDSLGNEMLDANGNGTETVFDKVSRRGCHLKYESHLLKEAYYLNEEGKKVYQYCDRQLKVNRLDKLYNLKQQILAVNWECFPQGTVLVKFIVDEEAYLKKVIVLNAIEPKLDAIVNGFFYLNKNSFTFRAAKHKDEKVIGEVVLPIFIGVKGYGPTPSANNSMWMMQQQQMHMMQMNNSFRVPTGF